MTILIKSNTVIGFTCDGRCTKVWRWAITTPAITLLVALCVTGEMEAFIKRRVTYQHLIFVFRWRNTPSCPQAKCVRLFIVVAGKFDCWPALSKSCFLFGLFVNKHCLSKLKYKMIQTCIKKPFSSCMFSAVLVVLHYHSWGNLQRSQYTYWYIVAICSISGGWLGGKFSLDIDLAICCVAHGPTTTKGRHITMHFKCFTTSIWMYANILHRPCLDLSLRCPDNLYL